MAKKRAAQPKLKNALIVKGLIQKGKREHILFNHLYQNWGVRDKDGYPVHRLSNKDKYFLKRIVERNYLTVPIKPGTSLDKLQESMAKSADLLKQTMTVFGDRPEKVEYGFYNSNLQVSFLLTETVAERNERLKRAKAYTLKYEKEQEERRNSELNRDRKRFEQMAAKIGMKLMPMTSEEKRLFKLANTECVCDDED